MERAKRFRALLAKLRLNHPDAAKVLHVSLRTLPNWLSGRPQVPYNVYKLFISPFCACVLCMSSYYFNSK